jgi:ATP synthase protein I
MIPMIENNRSDDEALKARLERLASALQNKRNEEPRKSASDDASASTTGRALNLGVRVLSEFVAGIIVGLVIGLVLDNWFSTKPLFLIVFLAFGTAAGFYNVYRIAAGPQARNGGSS